MLEIYWELMSATTEDWYIFKLAIRKLASIRAINQKHLQ
jgi:hypothetical protein